MKTIKTYPEMPGAIHRGDGRYTVEGDVCEVPGAAFTTLVTRGWKGTGNFKWEISRALGRAWPVCIYRLTSPIGRRVSLRFVGKPEQRINLFSRSRAA